jgi:hypothetical protein
MSEITYAQSYIGEDDIELYVTNDGKVTGVSLSGLAKLCGVTRKAISQVTNSLTAPGTNTYPKSLEPLAGKVFNPEVTGERGAKIVMEDVAIRIVEYYAYESRVKTDVAKTNFRLLAQKGLNAYIKELTPTDNVTSVNLNDIQNTLTQLLLKVDENNKQLLENQQIVVEYKQLRNTTVTIIPGVDKLLNDYLELDSDLTLTSSDRIPLTKWLEVEKGCTLDRKTLHKLAHLVSGAYKSTTNKEPVRGTFVKRIVNGKKKVQANTCLYSSDEFPILEMAFNNLMGV